MAAPAITSPADEIKVHPVPSFTSFEGLLAWVKTTDHKLIGILYLMTALVFFLVGGIEALFIRLQLAVPQNHVLTPQVYDELFTMHGVTMIFLVIMPGLIGFANYFVPLQIGYRDMAFPRLNAMTVWLTIFGGLLLYFSLVAGSMPDVGWFSYANYFERPYDMTNGPVYWAVGLIVLGAGSIATSLNMIVTIIAYRCRGMSLNRMPPFTWMVLVTSFLIIWAMPFLTADSILLLFDRFLGTHFFQPTQGANVVLWQHLFWGFGHPEVYILILPAFGMASEMFPVFSRKPLFGYTFVIFSGVAIGFISFLVWAHHMFTTGLTQSEQAFFAATTMVIAVPTGVKIFNWLGTMWGGAIQWTTSMKYCAAFILTFTIGGITGVMFAAVPLDYATTDTYFVVAHFHYVLFGGTALLVLGAIYYWFPKITGRLLSERMGTWQFWTTFVGMNLTFFPMHFLVAQPRRTYTYTNTAWTGYNFIETIGAFILAFGVLLLLINIWRSLRHGQPSGPDPWNGYSLEWSTTSPPPAYNFAEIPTVRSRRPLWDLAHPEMPDWRYEHHDQSGLAPPAGPDGGVATAARPVATEESAPRRRKAISPAKMLMLFFISSESLFFVSLIVMYSVYSFHFSSRQLEIPRTYFFSIALFASSGTMILAEKFLARGNKRGFVALLLATIALGAIFLLGQVTEYIHLYQESVTLHMPGEFGTTFFTLTGFHGFHVFVGLLALTGILLLSRDWKPGHETPVQTVGYYWHFVDGVWVFIFSIVYLRTLF